MAGDRPTSLWRDAWKRLRRNKLAVTGLLVVLFLVAVAAIGPWITPYDFLSQNLDARNLTPSLAHPFGTDDLGRDVISRVIYGARTAFLVAVCVTAIALAIGVVLGAIAGFYGGAFDRFMMWFTDMTMSVPQLLLVVVINASLKQPVATWMEAAYLQTMNPIWRNSALVDFVLVFGSMALISWPPYARLVRAQVLSIRNRPYVTAARALGLTNRIHASGGTATFAGRDLLKMNARQLRAVRGSEIGFIFQDPMTSLNPVMRIGDQIAEALIYQKGIGKTAALARAEELLHMVGIPGAKERMTAHPHELSGGMRQRVMIAMGLAGEPRLLIADEPTTALDVTIQAQIVDLVRELKAKSEMSVVWITHDLALIAGLADRIAVLYAGTVVEDAPVAVIFDNPTHPYTRALLSAVPEANPRSPRNRQMLQGEVPSPLNPPNGCRFHTRCPLAREICRSAVPVWREIAPGHHVSCHAVTSASTFNWEPVSV